MSKTTSGGRSEKPKRRWENEKDCRAGKMPFVQNRPRTGGGNSKRSAKRLAKKKNQAGRGAAVRIGERKLGRGMRFWNRMQGGKNPKNRVRTTWREGGKTRTGRVGSHGTEGHRRDAPHSGRTGQKKGKGVWGHIKGGREQKS